MVFALLFCGGTQGSCSSMRRVRTPTVRSGPHVLGTQGYVCVTWPITPRFTGDRNPSIANGIRLLANTVRGLAQRHIRILFKTCVLPILTYASSVWFRTDRPQKTLLQKLEKVQNISLRQICGGFRTTPVPAIQALSHQPPIELTLRKLSESTAIRLLKLPFRSQVSQRLPDVWRKGRKGDSPFRTIKHLPHNPATSRYLSPIEHLSSLSDPKGERVFPFANLNRPDASPLIDHPRLFLETTAVSEEEREPLIDRINSLTTAFNRERHIFFCDGSLNNEEGAGSGVVHYCQGDIAYEKDFNGFSCIGAGPKATAYDAEMLALAIAGSHVFDIAYEAASNPNYPLSEIRIYSDSTSALQNITDPSPHPGQLFSLSFIDHINLSLLACPDLKIFLCWSPGHRNVTGNEAADRVAKAARQCRGFRNSTIAFLKRKSKEAVVSRWSSKVLKLSKGTAFINHFHQNPKPSDVFKDTPREVYGRVSQVLSGHGYTGEYYSRMNIPESPWCPCSTSSGAPIFQSGSHILRECRRYSAHRHILEDACPDLHDPDWQVDRLGEHKTALPALVEFLKSSGAFTKLGIPFHLNLILPPERPKKPP